MKSTGMIRQLDALGRVVLPIELRRTLDIKTRESLRAASGHEDAGQRTL